MSSLNSATKARREAENLVRDCDDDKVGSLRNRRCKRIRCSLSRVFSKTPNYDLKQEQAASERFKFFLVSLLVVDTRSVETTTIRTQNVQVCTAFTQMQTNRYVNHRSVDSHFPKYCRNASMDSPMQSRNVEI